MSYIFIDPKGDEKRWLLREQTTPIDDVFNGIGGVFLLGVGGFMMYVLFSGGGPAPVGGPSFSWLIMISIFCAVPLLLIYLGARILFYRFTVSILPSEGLILKHSFFGGEPFRCKSYSVADFKEIVIRRASSSKCGTSYSVAFSGVGNLELASFKTKDEAEELATSIGAKTGLNVITID